MSISMVSASPAANTVPEPRSPADNTTTAQSYGRSPTQTRSKLTFTRPGPPPQCGPERPSSAKKIPFYWLVPDK
ncbi:hypothetical protein AAFM46_01145 [Arthrobacter sp. TMP15]|uniref:hypothetical protein n=1 Tax=Arthrobacter sp. TMP15 TaxID=3140789 RepID=UPI0031BB95DF